MARTRPRRRPGSLTRRDGGVLPSARGAISTGSGIPGQSAVGIAVGTGQWKAFREMLLMCQPRLQMKRPGEAPLPARRAGGFPARIIIPTVLAAALFVVSIFALIIPRFEETLLEKKKDTIRELTNSVVSVIAEFAADEKAGRLTREEAQKSAAARVRDIRYGAEGKDYFWITDMHPTMIMHPYREDLVGKDVGGYADANGVRVFVEFVKAVREKSEGYVEYLWQWKEQCQPHRAQALLCEEIRALGLGDRHRHLPRRRARRDRRFDAPADPALRGYRRRPGSPPCFRRAAGTLRGKAQETGGAGSPRVP